MLTYLLMNFVRGLCYTLLRNTVLSVIQTLRIPPVKRQAARLLPHQAALRSYCSIRLLLLQLYPRRVSRDDRACGCGLKSGHHLYEAEHLHVHGGLPSFHLLKPHPSQASLRLSSARKRTMSSPLPKSESTTSLLKSSGLNRRSAHSDRGPRGHRGHRTHHPIGAEGGGDAAWTEDYETSVRRPLCQPRHAESRNVSDHHRVQRSHSHQQPSHLDDGYAEEDVRHRTSRHQKERSKSSRSKHHHHHHDSSQGEQPPAAHLQGGSRQDRRTSPTPSYPKHPDDAAFFFEPSERVITGSSSSLSSDTHATSAPVQSSSSRTSKRLSTASEYDSSLHPIVKSVFGQVRGGQEEINLSTFKS